MPIKWCLYFSSCKEKQTYFPLNIFEHITIIAFYLLDCGFEGEQWYGDRGIGTLPDGRRQGVHSECECKELCKDNEICNFWVYDRETTLCKLFWYWKTTYRNRPRRFISGWGSKPPKKSN